MGKLSEQFSKHLQRLKESDEKQQQLIKELLKTTDQIIEKQRRLLEM